MELIIKGEESKSINEEKIQNCYNILYDIIATEPPKNLLMTDKESDLIIKTIIEREASEMLQESLKHENAMIKNEEPNVQIINDGFDKSKKNVQIDN